MFIFSRILVVLTVINDFLRVFNYPNIFEKVLWLLGENDYIQYYLDCDRRYPVLNNSFNLNRIKQTLFR